jgi:hypothetical protein
MAISAHDNPNTASGRDGTAPAGPRSMWLFCRHYLEMVAAMAIGMAAAQPVLMLATSQAAPARPLRDFAVEAFVMAIGMMLAMAAWMRICGHGWRPIAEMSAAMSAGFILGAPAVWAGVLNKSNGLIVGHVLMLILMLAAMTLRRDHYSASHRIRRHPGGPP